MVRSLRWRIQAWHALTLFLVVAGFGSALYFELRRSRLDEIDAELVSGARVLEGVLRNLPGGAAAARFLPEIEDPEGEPPPPFPPPPPGRGPRGPRGWRPRFPGGMEGDPDAPPFNPRPRPRRPGPPADALARALSLPISLVDRYAEVGEPPYYLVRRDDGSVLAGETGDLAEPPDAEVFGPRDHVSRQRGRLREVILLGPNATRILVGRPIGRELDRLHRTGWQLALTGLTVFGVGLLGGWWLSSRAIRPIAAISSTVAGITSSNLSERIDLQGVDAELGRLGGLLNDMLNRLESSFEQQSRFTADASHELRTPVSVILTHVELALSRPRQAEGYREALETCGRAAGRMKSLVDDLLTLARADSGKLELKRGPVDLGASAADCAGMLAPLAAARGVRLRVDASPAELDGDSDRLTQVVTNLLTNALTYNRPRGEVRVTTAVERDEAVLTVADTGVGIPAEDLPFVFDRFYRVDRARSRESGGSGLGLAICKSVVEAHGGRIAVESEPGRGTTFTVRLPRAAPTNGDI